jgi:simple sugar transport system permease protein
MIQHSLPRRLLHNHSGVVSIALFFVFCCVVFSLITSNFLTGTNWLNIIRQSAPLLIVATAMTWSLPPAVSICRWAPPSRWSARFPLSP